MLLTIKIIEGVLMRPLYKSSLKNHVSVFGAILVVLSVPLSSFAQEKALTRQHPIYKTIDDEQNRLHWDYWGSRVPNIGECLLKNI
jgi:hypothetical protein